MDDVYCFHMIVTCYILRLRINLYRVEEMIDEDEEVDTYCCFVMC